jgi:hypothetical protein
VIVGAWGSGPFDNDDACDWSYQLLDGGGVEVVSAALDVAPGVEAPEAAKAVAAVALVMASQGLAVDLTEDMAGWLATADRQAVAALAPRATAAIDILLTDSELAELWDESGDSIWGEQLRAWRDALRS